VVGDRGILTEDNLKVLSDIEAVEGKVKEQVKLWEEKRTPLKKRECFFDVIIDGRRFVISHNEEIARQTTIILKNIIGSGLTSRERSTGSPMRIQGVGKTR